MTAKWINNLGTSNDGRRILEQERLIMEVTETIARLLEDEQISRVQLAQRINKSPAFVTKLLRGNNNFTLRTLSDVLFALNRSVHFTLSECGDGIQLCDTRQAPPMKLNTSNWHKSAKKWDHSDLRLVDIDDLSEGIAA